jgi:hypothetical protein
MKSDAFFVITDYNHLPKNLSESWIPKYTKKYLIYDKAKRWEENENIKNQINVGQSVYDMFDFIVNNYDNLPEIICFVKADVIPRHCGEEKFSKIIHNKEYTTIENYSRNVNSYFEGAYSFVDENDNYNESSIEINNTLVIHPAKYFNSYQSFLSEIFENPEFGEYIKFPPGGCHLIPRKNILKFNKNFYECARQWVSWEIRPGEAFLFERATQTIFTSNWNIKEKYKGKKT